MAGKVRGRQLSPDEISTFCAQVAMFLKAGIPMGEGISILCEDMKNSEGKAILEEILRYVEAGEPLHQGLEAAGRFPKYVVDMVEIGEQSGRLDEVMDSLCAYYEREEGIKKSIRNAVTYPAIMIAMMVLVIGVLVVKVLPIFNQVFLQLGGELTGFSRSVMRLGTVLGRYSAAIVAVAVGLIAAYLILRATEGGRRALGRLRASFFATRGMAAQIASGRFASAMSLMLSSGLDTGQSLEMAGRLVGDGPMGEKIAHCKELMEEGASFSQALGKAGIFTGIYARMVSVGFKTGAVDTVMKKLAERYEEEIDAKIGGVISILEPTLVAVLSIVVGLILLSVMLPLMGIMSTIG